MQGIPKDLVKKIKKDIQSFKKSYVTAKKFKFVNDLKIEELKNKIRQIENVGIISDYATLKNNILR